MARKKAPAKRAVRKKTAAEPLAKPSTRIKPLPETVESPDQLSGRVTALVEAWTAAAATPSAENLDRLAKLSSELEAGARSVRQQAEASAQAARVSAMSLRRLRSAVPAVAEAAPQVKPSAPGAKERMAEEEEEGRAVSFGTEAEGATPTKEEDKDKDNNLESFFQQVSSSVVKAQQQLDMTSLSYAQELKDSPIPPSLFSIPKVSAEIKLGLKKGTGSNVLVTVFGKPEDTTNFSETTVSFDVVSAPPPPGGAGIYSAPIPSVIVVGPQRDRAAAAIRSMSGTIRAATGVDLSTDPATWLPTAIVIRAGAQAVPTDRRAEYLFVKRGDSPDKPVFTVRFTEGKPGEAKIVNITDANLKLALFDLVATLREWETSVTLPVKA
jgi:hypothetical protein